MGQIGNAASIHYITYFRYGTAHKSDISILLGWVAQLHIPNVRIGSALHIEHGCVYTFEFETADDLLAFTFRVGND